jgi:hypothetical protein
MVRAGEQTIPRLEFPCSSWLTKDINLSISVCNGIESRDTQKKQF